MADIFDLLEIMVKAERAAVRLQLLHDGKAQIYRREAFKLFQTHPAELWETSENTASTLENWDMMKAAHVRRFIRRCNLHFPLLVTCKQQIEHRCSTVKLTVPVLL